MLDARGIDHHRPGICIDSGFVLVGAGGEPGLGEPGLCPAGSAPPVRTRRLTGESGWKAVATGADAEPGVALPGVRHYSGFVDAADLGSSWAGARGSGGGGGRAGARQSRARAGRCTAGSKPASERRNRLEAGWMERDGLGVGTVADAGPGVALPGVRRTGQRDVRREEGVDPCDARRWRVWRRAGAPTCAPPVSNRRMIGETCWKPVGGSATAWACARYVPGTHRADRAGRWECGACRVRWLFRGVRVLY